VRSAFFALSLLLACIGTVALVSWAMPHEPPAEPAREDASVGPIIAPVEYDPWFVHSSGPDPEEPGIEPPVEVKRWAPRKAVPHAHAKTTEIGGNGAPIIE